MTYIEYLQQMDELRRQYQAGQLTIVAYHQRCSEVRDTYEAQASR